MWSADSFRKLHEMEEMRKKLADVIAAYVYEAYTDIKLDAAADKDISFYGRAYGEIEKLSLKEVEVLPDRMRYVWGGPGPDFDDFKFVDYGKTWSFNEEDLRGNNAGT